MSVYSEIEQKAKMPNKHLYVMKQMFSISNIGSITIPEFSRKQIKKGDKTSNLILRVWLKKKDSKHPTQNRIGKGFSNNQLSHTGLLQKQSSTLQITLKDRRPGQKCHLR